MHSLNIAQTLRMACQRRRAANSERNVRTNLSFRLLTASHTLCLTIRYFRPTPQRIYVRVEPLPEGVDPIWYDGGRGKRYVGD